MYVTSVQIILHDGNDDDDLHVLQWWLHSAVSCFVYFAFVPTHYQCRSAICAVGPVGECGKLVKFTELL